MLKRSFALFSGMLLTTLTLTKIYAVTPDLKPVVAVAFVKPESPTSYPGVIFHLNGLPKNQEIEFKVRRPLIDIVNQKGRFIINDQEKIIGLDKTEKDVLEMTAKGYFPGERVVAIFQTKEGRPITSASFIPYAIVCEIPEENLILGAELVCISPNVNYELTLHGLQEGEKFILQSKSGKENIRHEHVYQSKDRIAIAPAVFGEIGGVGKVSIITKKGTLSLQLPWGLNISCDSLHGTETYKSSPSDPKSRSI